MNTFPNGVVPTTASDCPRPWFLQSPHPSADHHHQAQPHTGAQVYHPDQNLHISQQQQQQQHPPHTQASRVPTHSPLEQPHLSRHTLLEQPRLPSQGHQEVAVNRPRHEQRIQSHAQSQQARVQHEQARIPSPVQMGLPHMMSHSLEQARLSALPYRDQTALKGHSQADPPRVPSRSQLDQPRIPSPAQHGLPPMSSHSLREQPRIPSPAQHGIPPMASHGLHEPPRVPSRSHLEQARIPSPAHHELPEMSSHPHLSQRRMSNHAVSQSEASSHQQQQQQQDPGRMSSHVSQHAQEQPRIPSHTPHEQLRIPVPNHNQHDQQRMRSHTPHEQLRMPQHTTQEQSRLPPHTSHEQPRLPPHTSHEQPRLPPHTSHEQAILPPHTSHEQVRMPPHTSHEQVRLPPHTSHEQVRLPPHTSHEQVRLPPHTSHEQVRLPPHTSHEQVRLAAHSSHEQPRMPPHTAHEQPRVPSRSQHDQLMQDRHGDQHSKQPSHNPQQSTSDQSGCLDIHTISETIRQMTKQHTAAVASSQAEFFSLPLPLCSLGQGLPQFPKPTQGLLPYLPAGGFKPTDTPVLKCTHCNEMFASPVQLQSHMISHYEIALRSLPASHFTGEMRPGDLSTVIKTEKDTNGHEEQYMQRKDFPWKDLETSIAAAGKSGGSHLGQPISMETNVSLPETATPNMTPGQKAKKPVGEKKHECMTCHKRFTRTDHLKRHAMKSHPEVMAAAAASGISTCTPQHLGLIRNDPTQIIAKKNEGQHQCFICGKRFKRSDHLKRHMLKCHADALPDDSRALLMRFNIRALYGEAGPPPKPPKPRPPPVVPDYTEAEKLEKRHVCITCEKRFKRQDHLKRHMTIHSEEKPYNCVLCGKGFRREHHVQRHERTHTGEKPYECVTCGKRFARIDHMKKHNKSHLFDGIRKPGQKLNPVLPSLNVPVSQPMCEEIPNIS